MIVSHEHRFIFLKMRKTAGTSVELVLAKLAGHDAIVTPLHPAEADHRPRNYHGKKARPTALGHRKPGRHGEIPGPAYSGAEA